MLASIRRLIYATIVVVVCLYTPANADIVRPENCSGASPGSGYCSCWHIEQNGNIIPSSGWCASAAGTIACDGGSNNNCPYSIINPPPDPPGSEYNPSN